MYLTREDIVNAQDLVIESVDVPEWGGQIGLRRMSCKNAEAYHDFLLSCQNGDGQLKLSGMRAKLLSLVICDDQGNLLFSEDDLQALAEKDNEIIGRIFKKAKELNAIIDDAAEEEEKN